MMNSRTSRRRFLASSITASVVLSCIFPLRAAVYYWDPSGGGTFGGITGTDYWTPGRTILWTTSNTGATSRLNLITTTTGDDLHFGGPTAALGGGNIPTGFVNALSLNFNTVTGSVAFSGGVINLANAATIGGIAATGTHTISSSLTGAAITLTKTGAFTLSLSGVNFHTGATVVSSGILQLANTHALQNSVLDTSASITGDAANGLRTTLSTLTLGGLSGNKNLASVFTTNAGGYGSLADLTLNVGAGANHTYSGAIADGAPGMMLTKTGLGTQVLSGANTYTGSTTLQAGTLILDYSSSDSSRLSDTAALVLGNGTLDLIGGAHVEIVGSTTLTGAATVTRSFGSSLLLMNAITGTGTVNFGTEDIAITTNSNDASGILGGFATVGGTTWARNGGTGSIVAYTSGFVDVEALGGTIASDAVSNVRILGDGVGGSIGLGATTTTINTLLMSNGTTVATIDTAGKTLAVSGVMLAGGAESLIIGAAAGAGTLTTPVGGGTLAIHNFNPARSVVINALIADNTAASSLIKSGPGALVLAGANTHTGATVIAAGTVTLTGSLSGSAVTVSGEAVLNQSASSSIAGAVGLTHNSAGTSTLQGANSYSGPTTINSGALNIRHASALGTADEGTTVAAGAALEVQGDVFIQDEALTLNGTGALNNGALRNISGSNTWGGVIAVSSPARINADAGSLTLGVPFGGAITTGINSILFSGAGNITVAGSIFGSGALQKEGAGTLALAASNTTFTGPIIASAGTIRIQDGVALGNNTQPTIVLTGAALQIEGGISIAEPLMIGSSGVSSTGGLRNISGNNTWSGAVTFVASSRFNSDSGTLTISGAMQANGAAFANPAISFGGSGNIVVSGNISPHSATLVKDGSGTLTLTNSANTYGSTANGNTTINAGVLTIGGAGRLNNGAFARNIVNNATFNFSSSATQTFSGVISGAGAFNHTGAGTLTLTGSNTFTGDITVGNGTLVGAGATNSPGVTVFGSRVNTRVITVNNGGTLRFDSANITGGGHFSTAAPRLVINSGGVVTNADPLASNAVNNPLNDVELHDGTLTSTTGSAGGYGAWNINGTVTSTGASTISTSDPVKGGVMLKSTGDFTTTFNVLDGTLTVSAPLIESVPDLNVDSLIKSGAGTMILTAASTYTGTTTVDAGTLLVNGSLSGSSAVTVNPGGTLGGDGTVGGATVVLNGGKLSPGANATGTLTFASSLNISAVDTPGSILFELGANSDLVLLTGGVLAIGSGTLGFGDFAFTATAGFEAGAYTLFDTTNTISGTLDPLNLDGFIGAFPATLGFADAGRDIVLTVAPEPSSLALLGLGVLGLLRRPRSR